MNNDIYNNGTYIENNKTLHSEDSEYKFLNIKKLLDEINFSNKKVFRILDIGGGAGIIGKMVCEYFLNKEIQIDFFALDLSQEMLNIQVKNNPYIANVINTDIMEINQYQFDLIMMIDVIEHIPDYQNIANKLNKLSEYVLFNIPLEINLFDKLRNIYLKGNYYNSQTKSIGHLHFFSYLSAKRFIKNHYSPIKWIFPDYCEHILNTNSDEYKLQRSNKIRNIELKISTWIHKKINYLAPFLIQGSLFIIAKCDDKKNN